MKNTGRGVFVERKTLARLRGRPCLLKPSIVAFSILYQFLMSRLDCI